ncbi:hypothetical protein Droror1_Dr00003444 [Drosera rotundifolia]
MISPSHHHHCTNSHASSPSPISLPLTVALSHHRLNNRVAALDFDSQLPIPQGCDELRTARFKDGDWWTGKFTTRASISVALVTSDGAQCSEPRILRLFRLFLGWYV